MLTLALPFHKCGSYASNKTYAVNGLAACVTPVSSTPEFNCGPATIVSDGSYEMDHLKHLETDSCYSHRPTTIPGVNEQIYDGHIDRIVLGLLLPLSHDGNAQYRGRCQGADRLHKTGYSP